MLDKTEFKIGQKVKVHGVKKIGTIREINWDAILPITIAWPINSKNEEIDEVGIHQIDRIVQ